MNDLSIILLHKRSNAFKAVYKVRNAILIVLFSLTKVSSYEAIPVISTQNFWDDESIVSLMD